MQTTREFLDAVRARHGLKSDYQLAKLLGVSHTRVSNWRTGRNTFDDETALQVAALLMENPAYVLASVSAERARVEGVREVWEDLAKKLAGVVAALVLVQFALFLWGDVSVADHAVTALMPIFGSIHYAQSAILAAWALLGCVLARAVLPRYPVFRPGAF